MALCICTREAVKIMRANDIAGHIIHMNSIVGHMVPNFVKANFNVYPASKFAVTALTESLRQELRYHETGIKVTVSLIIEKYLITNIARVKSNHSNIIKWYWIFHRSKNLLHYHVPLNPLMLYELISELQQVH